MAALADTVSAPEAAAIRRVLEAAREAGLDVRWGTGANRGSFNLIAPAYGHRSFASFLTDGEVWINLPYVGGGPETDRLRAELVRRLTEEVGLEPKGSNSQYWHYQLDEWIDRVEGVVGLVRAAGPGDE